MQYIDDAYALSKMSTHVRRNRDSNRVLNKIIINFEVKYHIKEEIQRNEPFDSSIFIQMQVSYIRFAYKYAFCI